MTQVDNANLQSASAYKRGEYASINLIYTPVKGVTIGGEFFMGQTRRFWRRNRELIPVSSFPPSMTSRHRCKSPQARD